MSMKVLINEYPHRTLALATDEHALVFRHTHSPSGSKWHEANPALAPGKSSGASPRCMVEFAPLSALDLSEHRNVAAARGCLGLITLNDDVFICVVTGSVEVATLRPGETVQRIYAVEFYCLNRSDYDHSYGHTPNPYPGQTFTSEEFEHGDHYDSNNVGENPFQALQKLLSSGSFYYSFDFDLTRRLQDRADSQGVVDIASLDEGLLWNSYMIDPLLQFRSRMTNHERQELDRSHMLTSVIRGFARTLAIPPSSSPIKRSATNSPSSLTVISRLSSRRAGTRFNSRGIDDNGNVANFVETETIYWSPTGLCFSYTQVRGSVPLFWESSSSLIPGQQKVSITRSPEATQPSFDKHFAQLEKAYGALHVLNLLSKSRPAEVELSDRYRDHLKMSPLRRHDPDEVEDHTLLRATEFDFNEYTKGGSGFEGAKAIRPYIDQSAESYVYFLSEEVEEWVPTEKGKPHKLRRPVVVMQQNGVFRVNCLDCLDRTNLVQGMLSQMAIELFLQHRSERSSSDFWMRHSTLWADNGDALSKIYAGTGALKSSFTRHGKMSLAGALADARKSATRLYVNHFEDKHRQNVVDVLLGKLQNQTSVDLFDPVNDWVVAELAKRRLEFEKRDEVKVFVGTYNLNGKSTGSKADLSDWLHARGELDDVVVVGFQEIVELSPQQIMSTDPNRRMVWESGVRACLNGHMSEKGPAEGDEYVLLRSGQLVGAALLIFVRARMLSRIQNVEGAIKKTGMSGIGQLATCIHCGIHDWPLCRRSRNRCCGETARPEVLHLLRSHPHNCWCFRAVVLSGQSPSLLWWQTLDGYPTRVSSTNIVPHLVCRLTIPSIFLTIAPTYCSEVAPPALRGSMVAAVNFSIVIGQLLGYGVMRETQRAEGQNSYKIMYATQWGFAAVGLLLIPFVPDSPYRLLARNKVEAAKKSIRKMYGAEVVEIKVAEIQGILRDESASAEQAGSFKDCFNSANRKRTLTAISVFFVQNMSGIGWVVGYMGYFMQLSGMEGASVFDATVGVAGVMAVGNIAAWPLLEYAGRRKTIFWGMSDSLFRLSTHLLIYNRTCCLHFESSSDRSTDPICHQVALDRSCTGQLYGHLGFLIPGLDWCCWLFPDV